MTARRRLTGALPSVSPLGFGAGPLGDLARLDDREADRLLRRALELGVNVVDTAPSYGASEHRIGALLESLSASDRDDLVIVTKGGYGVAGVADWTPEVLARGIDQALTRLHTDRIDVFLLHSCPRERLERGDLFSPLEAARAAGKIRAFGYSGDNDALAWALDHAPVDVVECSVNIVDQSALEVLPRARERGVGVLAKRSIAGAPWVTDGSSEYRDRFDAIVSEIDTGAMTWGEIAIRFTAFAPDVSSALVGTRRTANFEAASEHVAKGPLPTELIAELTRAFKARAEAWPARI